MKREKSCGAIVFRKNGSSYDIVLLRHKFGGHWSFPKGHVELGENEFRTATREVKEETGIFIPVSYTHLYNTFALGVSNHITQQKCTISFDEGLLLVMAVDD